MAVKNSTREGTASSSRGATRRQIVAMLGGACALAALGRGTRAQEGTPAAGEWTFTDDAGKTVTLPKRPERIVADLNAAAPLWDFGIRPVAVSGWTISTDEAWGNIDPAMPDITANAGAPDPDLEQLLGLDADLFVTIIWGDEQTPYSWSFLEAPSYEQANAITPVIGISATGSADENAARFAELAALLGADLNSPELTAAKTAVAERIAEFSRLAGEAAGLTAIFAHADGEQIFVANPDDWADLAMYQALGLNIVKPDAEPMTYWEELSTEQAAKYKADIFFQSTRDGSFSLEELAAHPTLGTLPAIKAGQVAPWNQDFIQSYQGLTAALDVMIATLENAKDVTE